MSVIRSKRGEASTEFINTARELNIFSIRECVKFPKRYTFYIGQDIANCANKIYEDVMKANSLSNTDLHESQLRRDFFLSARGNLKALICKISLAKEMFGIDGNKTVKWMELIDYELRLIKGTMRKDKIKFKEANNSEITSDMTEESC